MDVEIYLFSEGIDSVVSYRNNSQNATTEKPTTSRFEQIRLPQNVHQVELEINFCDGKLNYKLENFEENKFRKVDSG